jgi:hypothetical protein
MERVIVALVLFIGLVSARAAATSDEHPGMRAYIDPRTGGFATEPPPGEPLPALGATQSQSAADLQAVPAPPSSRSRAGGRRPERGRSRGGAPPVEAGAGPGR